MGHEQNSNHILSVGFKPSHMEYIQRAQSALEQAFSRVL